MKKTGKPSLLFENPVNHKLPSRNFFNLLAHKLTSCLDALGTLRRTSLLRHRLILQLNPGSWSRNVVLLVGLSRFQLPQDQLAVEGARRQGLRDANGRASDVLVVLLVPVLAEGSSRTSNGAGIVELGDVAVPSDRQDPSFDPDDGGHLAVLFYAHVADAGAVEEVPDF